MSYERRRRGFERAGSVAPERLGLSKSRARELVVSEAWNRVAGPAIAARTCAVRLRRGLLEIEVDDGPWAATLAELMPRLSGRLAAERPELGLRNYRLVRPGSGGEEPTHAVLPVADSGTSPSEAQEAAIGAGEASDRPLADRLSEVVRLYLARRKG